MRVALIDSTRFTVIFMPFTPSPARDAELLRPLPPLHCRSGGPATHPYVHGSKVRSPGTGPRCRTRRGIRNGDRHGDRRHLCEIGRRAIVQLNDRAAAPYGPCGPWMTPVVQEYRTVRFCLAGDPCVRGQRPALA